MNYKTCLLLATREERNEITEHQCHDVIDDIITWHSITFSEAYNIVTIVILMFFGQFAQSITISSISISRYLTFLTISHFLLLNYKTCLLLATREERNEITEHQCHDVIDDIITWHSITFSEAYNIVTIVILEFFGQFAQSITISNISISRYLTFLGYWRPFSYDVMNRCFHVTNFSKLLLCCSIHLILPQITLKQFLAICFWWKWLFHILTRLNIEHIFTNRMLFLFLELLLFGR